MLVRMRTSQTGNTGAWAWRIAGFGGLLLIAARFGASQADDPSLAPAEPIHAPGIENLYRLDRRLYSGSQPEGVAAFEALRQLGVRTIISVDGTAPDADAARRHGIRTIHIPVGYDGVPRDAAARLIKAAQDAPGAVFIHCHHGKHRGPAAAAVCARALDGWDAARARLWLEQAGTSPEYPGLFASVATFQAPGADELAAVTPDDLPERADVPDLVEAMAAIDARFDRIKAARTGSDADLRPLARLLAEQLREAGRLDDARRRGPEFLGALRASEAIAAALEVAPTPAAIERVARSCTACHARFRDRPAPGSSEPPPRAP
jgi:protein tyrosine phosphatase (PTP) superfamily phosphohydrolase (DUF442 family)